MATTSELRRAYKGPLVFSHGFRAFFLGAGIWATLAMVLWVGTLAAGLELPSRYVGGYWHQHEMLFGYTTAVIAGFLLTAVPNWTGRLPVVGWPTAMLSGLWLLGRLAILISDYLPEIVAPVIDLGFLVALTGLLGREIILARNWRNMPVLAILAVLFIADLLFTLDAVYGIDDGGLGLRLGAGAVVFLIVLIGGRVVPSFTRNWLAQRGGGRLPVPMNRFDMQVLAATAVGILVWVAAPESVLAAVLAALVGALQLTRLWRWVGWRTFAEPLVTIMHVGYLFIPLGFLTIALGRVPDSPLIAGLVPHAWMAGAVAVMTLAMMTRAALGHSGRKLTATRGITAVYLLVILAALARMTAEFLPSTRWLLDLAGTFWILGFGGFTMIYYPILTRRRA